MYSIYQAFKNIFQNKFISFISILSISLVFIFINLISSINYFSLNFIQESSQKIENQIYLTNTSQDSINSIQNYLLSIQNIEFQVINEETALNNLNQKYPNLKNFLEKNKIQNPLPKTIIIKSQDLTQFKVIKDSIQNNYPKEFDQTLNTKTNASLEPIIQNLIKFKNLSNKILIISTLSLIVISTLILMISIRNNFHTRKNEIQIMQMLGAKYSKIQNPIVLESNIIILLGLLIGYIVSQNLIQILSIQINAQLIQYFLAVEIAIAILIASSLSIIICRKQLKKERLIHDL